MRFLRRALLACLVLYLLATAARIYFRKLYIWLPDYLADSRPKESAPKPVHVFFLFTDHFEPGQHFELTRTWEVEYPKLAARHKDSRGRPVQHSWFYPGEQ